MQWDTLKTRCKSLQHAVDCCRQVHVRASGDDELGVFSLQADRQALHQVLGSLARRRRVWQHKLALWAIALWAIALWAVALWAIAHRAFFGLSHFFNEFSMIFLFFRKNCPQGIFENCPQGIFGLIYCFPSFCYIQVNCPLGIFENYP